MKKIREFTTTKSTQRFDNLRRGFTLAEVLITLIIIGVVAALTIPTLWDKVNTIVNRNRKEVIEDRLLEGLNQLNTLDDGMNASQYTDTEGFVKALSKYHKMSQICGANDLQNCFPYNTINYTDDNGEATVNVTDLKTAENFKLSSDDYLAPAGFISAQGTPFIMLLKKDCIMDTEKAMQSIPTSCIQYMYDRNGTNNPNKLGTDIIHSADIGIATASSSSKVMPDGTFDIPIDEYTTYLIIKRGSENYLRYGTGLNTCEGRDYRIWDDRCNSAASCSRNAWAAAKKACEEAGYELPNEEQLQELYCRAKGASTYQYVDVNDNSYYGVTKNCKVSTIDNTLADKVTEAQLYGVWTSERDGDCGAIEVFLNDGTVQRGTSIDNSYINVVCFGK